MGWYTRLKNRAFNLISSKKVGDISFQQHRALRNRVQESRGTVFAKEYGLDGVDSVVSYQQQVPVFHYADMEKYWAREAAGETGITLGKKPAWFGLSTGTTGKRKLLPISASIIADFRSKYRHLISLHLRKNPDSRILSGKIIGVSGASRVGQTESGIPYGYISGVMAATAPAIHQAKLIPSKDLIDIQDWDEKKRRIAEQTKGHRIGCIFGFPTVVLDLLETIKESYSAREFRHFTGDLEVLFMSGINYRPYQNRLYSLLGQAVDLVEFYSATEGIFGHQSLKNQDAMEFYTDHIFYEFIPFEDYQQGDYSRRQLITELREGEEYTVLITPGNGAFSYVVGDVIQCLDADQILFSIKGRTLLTLNMAGERTSISQVEKTVNRLCEEISIHTGEYFLTGQQGEERPYYLWVFEENEALQEHDAEFLSKKLDDYLFEHSQWYKFFYEKNVFAPCQVKLVPRECFLHWFAKKEADRGHTKVPRIITDPAIVQDIIGF